MDAAIPLYRCRLCGAATYQRQVHRGPDGAMVYSGIFRCSGCAIDFSDPADWRALPDQRSESGAEV